MLWISLVSMSLRHRVRIDAWDRIDAWECYKKNDLETSVEGESARGSHFFAVAACKCIYEA